MGSVIKGTCANCGYGTKDLYYGAGFRNFNTCCNYPVLDKVKREIKMGNIMAREEVIRKNPDLVFYDDEEMSESKIQNRDCYHEWGEYRLYNEGYICPKCNQFSLGFDTTGCYD